MKTLICIAIFLLSISTVTTLINTIIMIDTGNQMRKVSETLLDSLGVPVADSSGQDGVNV